MEKGERKVEVKTEKKKTTTTKTLRITKSSITPNDIDQTTDVVDGSTVCSIDSFDSAPTSIHSEDGNVMNIVSGKEFELEDEVASSKNVETEDDPETMDDKNERRKSKSKK